MRTAPSILHLDLDAFFASVEQLADPSLRGRPVVVGGLGNRGVVAAASYEARRFGIHSAMPMARARRACPDAAFLSPRFDAYSDASAQVMAVLRDVTPLVEPISLDEAFLDVGGARRSLGGGPEIGQQLRARIRAETGLTASVGAATTKLLAKLASDLAKPDGMLVVEPGTELEFLHPLPVTRLWGVGPATRKRLDRFKVETVGDLAKLPESTLARELGASAGAHLHALAWNRDDRPVEPDRAMKSIGHEETFARDRDDLVGLERDALRMADAVTTRLRSASKTARTVQLKIRYGDFRTITRSHTLPSPTDLAAEIGETARDLLRAVDLGAGIRLLGVSVQQLEEGVAVQGRLDLEGGPPAPSGERRALEEAVDTVRERFGNDAVGSAAFLERGRLRTGRRASLWGPDDPAPTKDDAEEAR
ncbi:MAG: DNA polymerase IV [Acidimicrobiia bacterium]